MEVMGKFVITIFHLVDDIIFVQLFMYLDLLAS